MKLQVSVVDGSLGVIKLKTSEAQVCSLGIDRFRENLYRMIDRAVEEIEKNLRDSEATYINKTLRVGKKILND